MIKKTLLYTVVIICLAVSIGLAQLSPMVFVEGGEFPYQRSSFIYVESFYIDTYETTNQLYCDYLNSAYSQDQIIVDNGIIYLLNDGNPLFNTYDNDPDSRISFDGVTFSVLSGKENHPVYKVSWYGAQAFAAWRSSVEGSTFRLPTEQEWEKAAAWDPELGHHYTYGFQQDSVINCDWCNYAYDTHTYCFNDTTEVGHFDGSVPTHNAQSYYGCYDMTGNVREWVDSATKNVRGGGWDCLAWTCETTLRDWYPKDRRSTAFGFRLVKIPPSEDFLLAYYPFNGNANDESGHGLNGTESGVNWCPDHCGVANRACCFDGQDDYIRVSDDGSLSGMPYLTVAFWMKPNSWPIWETDNGAAGLVAKMNNGDGTNSTDAYGFSIEVANGKHWIWGTIITSVGKTGINVPVEDVVADFDPFAWHHIAMTYDQSTLQLYLDGTVVGSIPYAGGSVNSTSSPFQVGWIYGSSEHNLYFNGAIDEVRIYNRALSDSEVVDLIEVCPPPPVLDALIDIAPDTLNVKSHGQYVTVYITLPDGYDVANIDTGTIEMTDISGDEVTGFVIDTSFTPVVGDRDEDGILDLTAKFDRQALINLPIYIGDRSITIEGDLTTGEHFTGSDMIRVIDRGK